MRVALAFAALATILRPTNVIIWVVFALYTAAEASGFSFKNIMHALALQSRDAFISGVSVLAVSILSDRIYYNDWIFPPARFIHFNVVQSLAVFYGRNRPDYYLTEGLPLLLTLTLPFAALGIWQALSGKQGSTNAGPSSSRNQLRPLAISVVGFIAVMSLISHKEVRFIYPLLPILHVLAAEPVARFFHPLPWPGSAAKKSILVAAVSLNVALALYASLVHQRGVVDVTHFLRHEHERKLSAGAGTAGLTPPRRPETTVLFLMPCHSTPWRSHLVHAGVAARALTCEPPLDVPPGDARAAYLDEADQFYAAPAAWVRTHMRDPLDASSSGRGGEMREAAGRSAWPEYLVFFEQLEPVMRGVLEGSGYVDCWRGFNTHWHDDWRRKGEVVVWCLR
ncbi:hypothetical protein MBLNU459_g5625t3 [Dothideomycetes sp. NU459]